MIGVDMYGSEQTIQCPICKEPYKFYPYMAQDQSACPTCVQKASSNMIPFRPNSICDHEFRRESKIKTTGTDHPTDVDKDIIWNLFYGLMVSKIQQARPLVNRWFIPGAQPLLTE